MQLILEDKGKVYIKAYVNIDLLPEYFKRNLYDPIHITFVPDISMTESECMTFLKSQREYIIESAKSLIQQDEDFFNFFDIKYYDFYKRGTLTDKKGNKATGECPMIVHCYPKDLLN